MAAIGYVTRNEKGGFIGSLSTLTIQTGIVLVPNADKSSDRQPDFRIFTDKRTEIGAAWNKRSKAENKEYVSLTFAAPELGPKKIYANLGTAAGQDDGDCYAIIWNPEG